MTLNQDDRFDIFVGAGQTTLDFTFTVGSTAGLRVIKRDKTTNVVRILALGPDYSVDLTLNRIALLGGEDPLTSDEDAVVESTGVFEQLTDFTIQNFINSTTAELTWDSAIAFIQELGRIRDLSIKASSFTDRQGGAVVELPFILPADIGKAVVVTADDPLEFGFGLGVTSPQFPTSFDPIVTLTDANTGGFVSRSISTETGSDTARSAILKILMVSTFDGSALSQQQINLKQAGTTPTTPMQRFNQTTGVNGSILASESVAIVPLDSTEKFEYEILFNDAVISGISTQSVIITLEGWYL